MDGAEYKFLGYITPLGSRCSGGTWRNIAKELNVSRPSVCAMLTKLAHEGYLNKEYYGIVYLCEKGKEIGKNYSAG